MLNKFILKKYRKKIYIKNLINIFNYSKYIIIYFDVKKNNLLNNRKVLKKNKNIFYYKIKNKIFFNFIKNYYKIFFNFIKNNIFIIFSFRFNTFKNIILNFMIDYKNIYYIIYLNFFLNPLRIVLLKKINNNLCLKYNIIYILKKNHLMLLKIMKYNNIKFIKLLKKKPFSSIG